MHGMCDYKLLIDNISLNLTSGGAKKSLCANQTSFFILLHMTKESGVQILQWTYLQ